jgi:hypothetical protein
MTHEISRFEASAEAALAFLAKGATAEQTKTLDEIQRVVSYYFWNRSCLDDKYEQWVRPGVTISQKYSHRSSCIMPKAAYARIMHEVSMHVFKNATPEQILGMLTGKERRPCDWLQEDVIAFWIVRLGGYKPGDGDLAELTSAQIRKNGEELQALLNSRIKA